MGYLRGLLLNPPGFEVNFFIVGIDVIYASFRSYPIGSAFPCLQGTRGSLFSGDHSGAQGRIFRKERFADALGQAEENWKDDRREEKRVLHQGLIIFFRGLFCQVGESC